MRKEDIYFIKLFSMLFCFFNVGLLLGLIANYFGLDFANFNLVDFTVIDITAKLILSVLILGLYFGDLESDLFKFKDNYKSMLKKSLHYFGIILLVKFIVAIYITMISTVLGIEMIQAENQDIIDSLIGAAPILMLISSVLLAPFLEEVLFRLGFKKIIKGKYPFIIISGLVFGLIHVFPTDVAFMTAVLQSIVYVALGVTLAYIYEKEDNIYLLMIVHALNNLFSLIVILLLL